MIINVTLALIDSIMNSPVDMLQTGQRLVQNSCVIAEN